MRSETQILDILDRGNVGYVILQQSLPEKRADGYYTYQQSKAIYDALDEGDLLLSGIEFGALSLKQKNLLADKLESLGMIAKANAQTNYVQMAYNYTIILVTR